VLNEGRWLTGWKSIAGYLNVSVRSAKRKVRRGMPVHREGQTIVAHTRKIDEWRWANVGQMRPNDTPKGKTLA